MLIRMKGDERGLSALDHQHLAENKAEIESHDSVVAILEGRQRITAGKNEPKEYTPQVPDAYRGVLLHGMQNQFIGSRRQETREECIVRHATLKQANIIAKDAPIRWFNPDTRGMEIIDGPD